jgi:hypothetical protein
MPGRPEPRAGRASHPCTPSAVSPCRPCASTPEPAPPLRLHTRAHGEPRASRVVHPCGAVRPRAPHLAHVRSRALLPLQARAALRLHATSCVALAPQALQACATLRLHARAHTAPNAACSHNHR